MKKIGFLFSFVAFLTHGQIDFKNFTTLQSAGAIPSDFSDLAKDKVANDKGRNDNLSEKSDEVFKRNVHYSMDQMLHSGQCVYGDPISVYIDKIAQKLLKDDKELYSKLRFYTLKSNVSNAFSTHQGIIIFTTGLISQFANEAQLAFVLAHEIIHYQENHVVQTFEWKLQNQYNFENINRFNNYSKDKEFEADSKAVGLCLKAGYSATEVYNSFDVLMFCHLPFDEIAFPLDYFNNPLFYVPEKEFTTEKYPIKMDEAYDDKNSTHPNVEKRKETIRPHLEANFGQGNAFLGSVEEFNLIRNCARFESVRTSLLDVEYSKALYQIFLLEKEFSSNYTLTRWKAHAWFGLLKAKINGFWPNVTVTKKNMEGESAILYEYIKKLDKYAVAAHTMRELTDAIAHFPESEELKTIRSTALKILASNEWSWTKYADITFNEHFAPKADTLVQEVTKADTSIVESGSLSKYDKIKGTGAGKNTTAIALSDSSKYYYYGISDLIKNKTFLSEYQQLKEEISTSADISKVKTKNKDLVPIIENRLIVVEPTTDYIHKQRYDYEKSDSHQNKLINAINYAADKNGVQLYDYSTNSIGKTGTDGFNQRNVMMSYLKQYYTSKETEHFVPVDFELIKDIQQKCGTSKVLFSWTEYVVRSDKAFLPLALIVIPPIVPFAIITSISKIKNCEIAFLVLNIETGEIEYAQANELKSAGGNLILKSEAHNLFHAKKQRSK